MFGLKEKDIKQLNYCFSKFEEIEKSIVFGSRAMGNYKNGSDVDIALIGEKIEHKTILKFRII